MLERNFEFIYGARSFRSRFMLKVREWMFDDGSKGSKRMFFYLPGPASFNNSILRAPGRRQFRRLVRYAKWINFRFDQPPLRRLFSWCLSTSFRVAKTIKSISFAYEIHELMKVLKLQWIPTWGPTPSTKEFFQNNFFIDFSNLMKFYVVAEATFGCETILVSLLWHRGNDDGWKKLMLWFEALKVLRMIRRETLNLEYL